MRKVKKSLPKKVTTHKIMQTIAPYNDFNDEFDAKKTPQWAYFATHWDIVDEVFLVPKPWWESAPIWMAVALVILVFIFGLVVFD